LRDWIVAKKIHPVYLYALPLLVIGQTVVIFAISREQSTGSGLRTPYSAES
jgi:hypothetical protein